MAAQEMPTRPATLTLLMLMHIFGLKLKRQNIINNVLSKYFKNSSSHSGWDKISDIIFPHNNLKIIPLGGNPSKDSRTSDTQSTPFSIDQSPGSLAAMWTSFKAEDLFLDGSIQEKMKIESDNTGREMEVICATRMWNAVCYAYESMYEIEQLVILFASMINSLYQSKSWIDSEQPSTNSPGQLLFFGGEYIYGGLMGFWDELIDNTPKLKSGSYFVLSGYEDRQRTPKSNYSMPSPLCGSDETGDFGPDALLSVPWDSVNIFENEINILKNDPSNIWYYSSIVPNIKFTSRLYATGNIGNVGFCSAGTPTGSYNLRVLVRGNNVTNWDRPKISAYYGDGFEVTMNDQGWAGANFYILYDKFIRQ